MLCGPIRFVDAGFGVPSIACSAQAGVLSQWILGLVMRHQVDHWDAVAADGHGLPRALHGSHQLGELCLGVVDVHRGGHPADDIQG